MAEEKIRYILAENREKVNGGFLCGQLSAGENAGEITMG